MYLNNNNCKYYNKYFYNELTYDSESTLEPTIIALSIAKYILL